MKKRLPYSGSECDPSKAQKRIRTMLLNLGVDRIMFDEDFKNFVLAVKFQYKDYPVSLPVDYDKLSKIYIEQDPWTYSKRLTENEWKRRKREIAYRAAFSILEDFLKSLITIVEMEIFSFEEIFFCYFTTNQGHRLGEGIKAKLPEILKGQLALTQGKKG